MGAFLLLYKPNCWVFIIHSTVPKALSQEANQKQKAIYRFVRLEAGMGRGDAHVVRKIIYPFLSTFMET